MAGDVAQYEPSDDRTTGGKFRIEPIVRESVLVEVRITGRRDVVERRVHARSLDSVARDRDVFISCAADDRRALGLERRERRVEKRLATDRLHPLVELHELVERF